MLKDMTANGKQDVEEEIKNARKDIYQANIKDIYLMFSLSLLIPN